MSEDDSENPYTLTGLQVVALFAFILAIACFAAVAAGMFDEPLVLRWPQTIEVHDH